MGDSAVNTAWKYWYATTTYEAMKCMLDKLKGGYKITSVEAGVNGHGFTVTVDKTANTRDFKEEYFQMRAALQVEQLLNEKLKAELVERQRATMHG